MDHTAASLELKPVRQKIYYGSTGSCYDVA